MSCVPAPALAYPTTPAGAATFAAAPVQTCPTIPDDKYKPFEEALDAANKALGKVKPAATPLETTANSIKEDLKNVPLKEETVAQFKKVADTVRENLSTTEGRLAALRKLREELNTRKSTLDGLYTTFEPCENASNAPDKVRTALAGYASFKKDFDAQAKVDASLADALKLIQVKGNALLNEAKDKALAAAVLREGLDAQTLRNELPGKLPGMATAMRVRRLFEPVAKELADAFDPKFPDIKALGVPPPGFKAQFAEVDKELKKALVKLPGWASQAVTAAQEEQKAAQDVLVRASRDPFRSAGELLALATASERARKNFQSMTDAIEKLLAEVQREDVPKDILPEDFFPERAGELSAGMASLLTHTARFTATLQQLRAEVPVDKSTWTMASVDLFYFDNVERLMRVLSPNVRLVTSLSNQNFQGEAQRTRRELDDASQEFETAQAEVSDIRQRVADLRERRRLARARRDPAVATQRTEQAALRRRADAAESKERSLTQRRKELDAQQAVAQRQVDRLTAEAEDKPDDDDLQKKLALAQRDLDRVALLAANTKAAEERAHEDAAAARAAADRNTTDSDAEVTELQDELNAAELALTEAEGKRATATTRHRTALRTAFLAAQAENFAFAQARDNAPFLTNLAAPAPTPSPGASPTPTPTPGVTLPDSDPVGRVLLFAYPDTRTIFIRGARDDIDVVRQIIKEFDRPQGQAMMTLRTLEVNSDGTQDGARRALRFLKAMDEKLRVAQVNVEGKLSELRGAVNARVKEVTRAKQEQWEKEIRNLDAEIRDLEAKESATAGSAREALAGLVASKKAGREKRTFMLGRVEETERVAFFEPRVLKALGWQEDFIDRTVDTGFLNAVIPSPSRAVNLAQALLALALASEENRAAVVRALKPKVTRPRNAGAAGGKPKDDPGGANAEKKSKEPPPPDPFASLRGFLGEQGDAPDILGFQDRLVGALRFNGITHLLEVAEAKVRQRMQIEEDLAAIQQEMDKITKAVEGTPAAEALRKLEEDRTELLDQVLGLNEEINNPAGRGAAEVAALRERQLKLKQSLAEVERKLNEARTEFRKLGQGLGSVELTLRRGPLRNRLTRLDTDLGAILGWLQGNTGNDPPEILRSRIEESIKSPEGSSSLLMQAVGLRRSARFRFTQAHESAVNLTFRKYLEQVNRDLTEAYVKPTFREINELLLKEKLGVGVIQETSILASNRLVARVDPRGSAQLAVGEEQDVLEAARQLTNLFGIAGKSLATAATGKPLALAGGPAGAVATTIETAQSVLSALDQLPREAAPTVYGIATGNIFQVTPVIDPSGQALRFRFDQVSATQIREPDDTINPQLPRIERHSVNTEVHLADQEIRLISQFQANSRVGLPVRKSGGLPVFKYIPGVKEVPFIGWFVRRGGRNAQTQQSFIFCQTAMFPTLGEVLDVTVQSPTFTGLDNEGMRGGRATEGEEQ